MTFPARSWTFVVRSTQFQRVAQELEKRPNALIFGGDSVQQYNRK